jgi:steroid delta-isomerase-like uncharacterized protein
MIWLLLAAIGADQAPSSGRPEQAQLAVFAEMMAAVNAGDAPRYARLYATDAAIRIVGGEDLAGRDAIERYEVELLRQFPGARLAFYSIWQREREAVVHYGVNGRTAAGQAMGHEGLLFYRFASSGLIEEERRYNDSVTPMVQLGMPGIFSARASATLPSQWQAFTWQGAELHSNIALVRAIVDAWNGGDGQRFLRQLAEDAVLDDLVFPQPFIGKAAVKTWFDTWKAAIPDPRSEITTLLAVGDAVIVETVVRGSLTGALGRVAASNKPLLLHRAAVFEIAAGKIARIRSFMNGKELAAAAGQWPLGKEH